MRTAPLALWITLLASMPAAAQSGRYLAVVVDPEVKLRAGPGDRMPETGAVRQGDSLVVHEEESGWLAVQDAPGLTNSVSWVQTQFIDFNPQKPTPQNVVVEEATTLAAGQMGVAQPMTHIRRAKVPAGTILTVIGPKVVFEGKGWYPVLPPAGDYRYVPKHSVRFARAADAAFAVRDTTPSPPPVSPAGGAAVPAGAVTLPAVPVGKSSPQHPLWAKAEAAERDRKYDEAERLFFQLAQAMNEPGGDHDLANLCYTRIHTIRERKRSEAGGQSASRTPPGGAAMPATGTSSGGGALPPAGGTRDDRAGWTGAGKLIESSIALDGRRTYRHEATSGNVVYVVAGPGVSLERYLGKNVDVLGTTHTRPGLTKPYVVATAVEIVK
jgi:uncharacterized protein YraI